MGCRGTARGLNTLHGEPKVIRLFYHTHTTDGVTYYLVRWPMLRVVYVRLLECTYPRVSPGPLHWQAVRRAESHGASRRGSGVKVFLHGLW